ncbi:hypothetical protein GCM10008066_25430 [Oxalicibacterium faecigallinarum]|uniref:Alpha/beta hydrolase n=1 Tax=Oxalicibacterium faecigallinarum TaxID=573741 RepID=A0A8J3ASJ9_9BURK|nr:alpha/beta hydrolase [Oxalicibacterium faecigallinarum]GGI20718.1 hypothetical protein GCM10008066_25430 [Oxalicibacterium faecigallinarum]
MTTRDNYRVLIVPGLHGSGPEHWQSRWEAQHADFERVHQDDWSIPDLPRWSWKLEQTLAQSDRPTLIVAHSFGCLTTIHANRHGRFNIAGALLVAPADPDKFHVANALRDVRLSCPSVVVGSTNDPWMNAARASYWADVWGCGFLNAGALGHINAESGLGDWEQGWQQFERLRDIADTLAHPRHLSVLR